MILLPTIIVRIVPGKRILLQLQASYDHRAQEIELTNILVYISFTKVRLNLVDHTCQRRVVQHTDRCMDFMH